MITQNDLTRLARTLDRFALGGEFHDFVQETLAYNAYPTKDTLQAVQVSLMQLVLEDDSLVNEGFTAEFTRIVEREQQHLHQLELLRKLQHNDFRVKSDKAEYEDAFGPAFKERRDALREGERWLDGGAGEANVMMAYLQEGGLADCVALGYQIPEGAAERIRLAEEAYKGRFKYISGKFFSAVGDVELDLTAKGRFRLITDLNGVLYYTHTLKEDLQRYLEILAVGGKLFYTSISADIDAPNARRDSRLPMFAKWASNIAGVKVTYYLAGTNSGCTEIEKTRSDLIFPDLLLKRIEVTSQNHPTREYECALDLPVDPLLIESGRY